MSTMGNAIVKGPVTMKNNCSQPNPLHGGSKLFQKVANQHK